MASVTERSHAAIEGRRKDMIYVDPRKLQIVGIDIDGSPDHPCWDPERVQMPLDPAKVDDVRQNGVTLPVVARKNGPYAEVVDGKQRTRRAREAEIPAVPVIFVRGTDNEIRRLMRALNSIREDDPPSARAAQAERMLKVGMPEEVVAGSFGIKPPMLKKLLRMQDLAEPVARLVDEGKVTLTDAATKLAKLPREKQAEAAKPLEKGVKQRSPKKPSKKTIAAVAEAIGRNTIVGVALRWAMGEVRSEAVGWPKLVKAMKAVKKGASS